MIARRIGRLAAFVTAVSWGCGGDDTPDGPVDLFASVDPFIGTGGVGFGVGSTYPGPALPFAMIHPGPDTRASGGAPGFSHCAGYWWEDPAIEAFSLLRMNGTGVADYGVIAFMPVDGMSEDRRDEVGYADLFNHADEVAEPGYYRVELRSGIEIEITSTLRAAIFRIQYPAGTDPVLLLDLEHTIGEGTSTGGEVEVDAAGSLSGTMHNQGDLSNRIGGFDVFASAAVDPAPSSVGLWDEAGLHPGAGSTTGVDIGAWIQFPAGTTEVVVRVAVSFVDVGGATANLAAEIPDFDFDGVRAAAAATWRDALSKVELEGASERDATLVATSLYRVLLMPTLMSDVDGRARNTSNEVINSAHLRYSDFSLWDTYRTPHPWLLLTEDAHNLDFARSLLAFGHESGAYPRWALAHGDVHSMVGSPADMVMAESAVKGVAMDEEEAFGYSLVTATGPAPGAVGGRSAIDAYLTHGYVPADLHGGSVAETLEYATADAALAEWARRLGRDADADALAARAQSWKQLYNPAEGFLNPRNSDGSWAAWTGPDREQDAYTEGTAWQYLWMVPNDLDGLAELLGGREAALDKLRELFALSHDETPSLGFRVYYWQGNEPDIIAPWIFAALGEPAESAREIDWIITDHYGTGADGLPGNDDGGTMSAWVLFAAAGIYPIAGTDRYIVAAPRQELMVLHRPSGDLRIEADQNPAEHPVPLEVTLDGAPLDGNELRHGQLVGDHVLRFTMGD